MSITEAIELLKAYNGPLGLTLHARASEELISRAEAACGITFPADFKAFYRFTDGFETEEDIFNMIPLKEIIENMEKGKSLYIAEYMIYCDMWNLEVDADNPEDYAIIADDGKIALTKSLGEFIVRFLHGGVFEIGGLYAWRDEINSTINGNSDPNQMKPLLWVYREGLKRGLVTKKEVVDRADWIIATEKDPHYFFIEISLSHDMNGLIEVLGSVQLADDIMQVRALFGLVNLKLSVGQISIDKALSILNSFACDERFTTFERDKIWGLTEDWDYLYDAAPNSELKQQLSEDIKDFFGHYIRFNLNHYKAWEKINNDLVEKSKNMDVISGSDQQSGYTVSGRPQKQIPLQKIVIAIGVTSLILTLIHMYIPGAFPAIAVLFCVFGFRWLMNSKNK